MMSIEATWRQLAAAGNTAQTRVDAGHPHDIYADFEEPDRFGLVVVSSVRPPDVLPLRTIEVVEGHRVDGRWTLRLALLEPRLMPVFAALCQDIVACTRSGVDSARLAQVVIQRLAHWRILLDLHAGGLGETTLRGLIGELLVLRDRLLPELGPIDAIRSWKGPLGAPQDFILPDGRRIEVKTTRAHADSVRINGLNQLDDCGDPLTLIVVRTEETVADAPRAVTAPGLIEHLRNLLADEPEALASLDAALANLRWHEHPSHSAVALRVISIEAHDVDAAFPRLTSGSVPAGILDADYVVALPGRRPMTGGEAS